jgi:hypothetical protein
MKINRPTLPKFPQQREEERRTRLDVRWRRIRRRIRGHSRFVFSKTILYVPSIPKCKTNPVVYLGDLNMTATRKTNLTRGNSGGKRFGDIHGLFPQKLSCMSPGSIGTETSVYDADERLE